MSKQTFRGWIDTYGVQNLARDLNVTDMAIRHWRSGAGFPRVHQMVKIKRLSKGSINYDQIIEGPNKKR